MASALPRNICFLHPSYNPPNNHLFFLSRTVSSPPTHAFRCNRHFSLHLRNGAAKSRYPRLLVRAEDNPDQKPPSHSLSTSASIISSSIGGLRKVFGVNDLGIEILSIALPAALALAADPITSLVDTAFVGHLGPVELAAVGISISVFNLVSKLFNVPLLNITTSFVAEEQASAYGFKNSVQTNQGTISDDGEQKRLLSSVSTSLALAAAVGCAEAVALSFGSGYLMDFMGISVDSPMHVPAEQFLRIRALGAPPIAIALAAQGTFRGFKDTKTPLYAIGAGNLLNAVLDLVLIFPFGFGISGAAIATVISEYLIALVLLFEMSEKVSFSAPNVDGSRLLRYLQSGGLLAARSLAVLGLMTLSTSMAAQQGPIAMAGHEICIQVWLAISLLTDALALAGQALLADDYAQGNYEQSRQVTYRVLQIGLLTGSGITIILFLGFDAFSSLFTSDPEVLKVAWSGLLFVAGSQPINAIAFVLDGLYYGVSDFGYAASSMIIAALISSAFMLVASPAYGLAGVWTSLFLFMTLRVLAGVWRLGTKAGPWRLIWPESK